jgi:hypothetical protein
MLWSVGRSHHDRRALYLGRVCEVLKSLSSSLNALEGYLEMKRIRTVCKINKAVMNDLRRTQAEFEWSHGERCVMLSSLASNR